MKDRITTKISRKLHLKKVINVFAFTLAAAAMDRFMLCMNLSIGHKGGGWGEGEAPVRL